MCDCECVRGGGREVQVCFNTPHDNIINYRIDQISYRTDKYVYMISSSSEF